MRATSMYRRLRQQQKYAKFRAKQKAIENQGPIQYKWDPNGLKKQYEKERFKGKRLTPKRAFIISIGFAAMLWLLAFGGMI